MKELLPVRKGKAWPALGESSDGEEKLRQRYSLAFRGGAGGMSPRCVNSALLFKII
jgi:hypothetical protein